MSGEVYMRAWKEFECEVCGEAITLDRPGAKISLFCQGKGWASVHLHNETCRLTFFTENPPTRWTIEYRIGIERKGQ